MAQATLAQKITVTPLSHACGAEISGVDLTKDLSADVIRQIQDAWNEHIVLTFRGQSLSQEDQLRFASHFGPLGKRKQAPDQLKERTEGVLQLDPHVLLVSNKKVDGVPVGAFGDGDMWYHIDSGYTERPYAYTFLYGVELPSWGGDTLFSNMYMAYGALPAHLKQRIHGKRALHVHEYKRNEKVTVGSDLSNTPHWYHPVVIIHPKTGRPSLFVDRLMTARIEGVSQQESDDILGQLYEIGESEEFVYAHKWQLGDFVMWDNLATIHARTSVPKEETRLLRRCTVDGGLVTAAA
jgi:taurine dioxygenase